MVVFVFNEKKKKRRKHRKRKERISNINDGVWAPSFVLEPDPEGYDT